VADWLAQLPLRFAAVYSSDLRRAADTAQAIAAKFPWHEYRTFVDVGAAEGALSVSVASAHPHVMGSGFDLPGVRPHFEAYVAAHSLSDRLAFHAGDFFADPLPRADVLVMDEPTDDRDEETLVLLEYLHVEYKGTLLLVSHVREFVDHVVTSTLVLEGPGRLAEYVVGYQDWLRQR